MQKNIFKVLAVLMIIGLLAGALAPLLLSFGSLNPSDANQEEIIEDSTLIQIDPEVSTEEVVD